MPDQLRGRGLGPRRRGRSIGVAMATLLAAMLLASCSASGSGPSGSRSATQVQSPIVGTWQVTVTKEDLQGIGVSDPGLLNENAGRFTRSFLADGTWTSAQESLDASPIHNPVWRGTYTVEGDQLRVQIDYPTEYQGAERYRFKVDGNELRLTMLEPTDDAIARLGAEAHPWTRTSP